ncbi:unnamed protein product [Adineta steineri]|uniref:Uncharacterized protein n=1 Tax=Adineta steineri TaxID=433720 RepID=A0A815X751_9BILA|nr:unnamed protein product [Adineta steineri]CAF1662217.1 unnamed protein product [Adineta steineri]
MVNYDNFVSGQNISSQESHSNEIMQTNDDEDSFNRWFDELPSIALSTETPNTNHSECNNINNSDTSIINMNNDTYQEVDAVDGNMDCNEIVNNQSVDNCSNEQIPADDDLSCECSSNIPMVPDQALQMVCSDPSVQNNNNNLSQLISSSSFSIISETMELTDSTLTTAITNDSNQSSHTALITSSLDPSLNQTDNITDFNSSYCKYSDLDRPAIAKLYEFNLQHPSASDLREPILLNTKSLAIISWTNVSKDVVMDYIKQEFKKKFQYICISEEINELNHQTHLYIQIIFKNKINRKTRLLDQITQTYCNYKVTDYISAWNGYIKKDLYCLEIGQFPTKIRGYKQNPPSEVTEKQKATRKKAIKAKSTTKKGAKTKATTRQTAASCISIPID